MFGGGGAIGYLTTKLGGGGGYNGKDPDTLLLAPESKILFWINLLPSIFVLSHTYIYSSNYNYNYSYITTYVYIYP